MKLKLKIFTYLCLLPAFSASVNAQTLVTPNNSDNTLFTTASGLAGFNTAMIAYSPTHPKYFFGTVAWGGGSGYVYVTDPSLSTTTANIASTGSFNGPPDIIIGNNNTGFGVPGKNFILATTFVNTSLQVEIDYYDVFDDGSTIAIQPLASLDPSLPNRTLHTPTGLSGNRAYSDIVADYGNTTVTGLPFCDQFVITWEELVSGGGSNKQIWASLCDLNTQSFGTPQLMSTASGVGQYGEMPDVAAIRRTVSGPSDYTAWVTYWDFSNTSLCLTEYDFSTNNILSQTVLDNVSPLTMSEPRIAAVENYTTLGSPAHYKVVTSVGGTDIRNYDNNLGAGSYYVSSQVIDVTTLGTFPWTTYSPSTYVNFFPTVAPDVQDYDVFHVCQVASNRRIMFMEPVNIFTSIVPTTGSYYWVNGTSSPLSTISNSSLNSSVSTAPNKPGLATVYAWMNGGNLQYKIKTPSTSFRPTIDGGETEELSLKVYPNPANSELIISGKEPKSNGSYTITDMTGRVLLQGATSATGNSNINIGSLAAGNYAISLYENGAVYASRTFVKN